MFVDTCSCNIVPNIFPFYVYYRNLILYITMYISIQTLNSCCDSILIWVTQYFASWQGSSPTPLQLGREGSLRQNLRGDLMIPVVKPSHAGFYTCQCRVLINNQQYKVSRAILLCVQGGWCVMSPHSICLLNQLFKSYSITVCYWET